MSQCWYSHECVCADYDQIARHEETGEFLREEEYKACSFQHNIKEAIGRVLHVEAELKEKVTSMEKELAISRVEQAAAQAELEFTLQ